MKKLLILPALLLIIGMASCQKATFKTTESGLTYKIHTKNKGDNPSIDNIAKIDFAYRFPADSTFFESKMNGSAAYIPIAPSGYPGDIFEGLRLLAKGDSATFLFKAKDFFTITAGYPMVPPFMKDDDTLYVDVMLHDFFTQEEYEVYMQKQREEMMKEQENAAKNELSILEKYLSDNNITTEPEASGLIIIVQEEGKGDIPRSGQTVTVNYTGMVLDGTVFDSSTGREPFEFVLGQGQVIRGWDEAISKLKVGSKARVIITSNLAYGDQQTGPVITPFSTLIFDIELVSAQ